MVTLSDFVHPARARMAADAAPESRVRNVCRQYRWASVACPADVLLVPETADWIRKRGVRVDVRSSTELALAVSAGIKPLRIVMHGDGANAGPLRCAVNAGVGQFVVSSRLEVAVLAQWARHPQRVLVDVTDGVDALAIAADRVEVIGLHCRMDGADQCAEVVDRMMGQMAEIRCEEDVLVTRLSLETTVGDCPRRMGEVIEDALDEACATFRLPRPAVAVSLRWPFARP